MRFARMIAPAVVLLLAGCGSRDTAPDAAVARSGTLATSTGAAQSAADSLPLPQPTGDRQIGARLTEYEIELTRDSLPAGELEFHVVNAGTTLHYLLVRSETVYELTPHLQPGDSAILRVQLAPGEYQYLCTIRDEYDHYSEGMRGTIVVY